MIYQPMKRADVEIDENQMKREVRLKPRLNRYSMIRGLRLP